MKFKAQWSQTPKVVETCECTIEAETSEEALTKFLAGDFDRFLVTNLTTVEETEVNYESVKWLKR